MTLTVAIARFERQLHADGRSRHTISSYLRSLRALRDWFTDEGRGDPDVADITPDDLARFVLSDRVVHTVDGRPRARHSTNHIKTAIRALFRYLEETGALERNPARALRVPYPGQSLPSVLTEGEQARLLATIASGRSTAARRDYVMFGVFLGTGIRLSSLVGLDGEDVRLAERRMVITGKGGRRESVVLSTRLRDLLAAHLETQPGGGPVFRSCRGSRISVRQVQYRLDYWCERAGLDKRVTPHGLRHTFGTRLYTHTRDLRLVQRALHHRSVTTTEVYTHLADDTLAAAVEAVG